MDIGRIMNVCDVVCVNIHVVDCFVCLCLVPMKVHSILALVAAAGFTGCDSGSSGNALYVVLENIVHASR